MNTSSRTPLEDRARRNAELEELRERGLARQWQQLLAESGGTMPMTMEAWLAQQRALGEEDRRQQQDAFDNLHKFRGVGLNEFQRKSHDSPLNQHLFEPTPDAIAHVSLDYKHDEPKTDIKLGQDFTSKTDDSFKIVPPGEKTITNETLLGGDETSMVSSSHLGDTRSDFISLGSESNMVLSESKAESLTDWVELHASETCALETKHPNNSILQSESTVDISSNSTSKKHIDILVCFGIISSLASTSLIGSETDKNSKAVTDILERFHKVLGRETNQPHCTYKLNTVPFIISTQNDDTYIHSSKKRTMFTACVPLTLDKTADERDVRSSVGRVLGDIFK